MKRGRRYRQMLDGERAGPARAPMFAPAIPPNMFAYALRDAPDPFLRVRGQENQAWRCLK